jgi:hypothetical protein
MEGFVHHDLLQATKRIVLSVVPLVLMATTAWADPIGINYSTSMVISDIGVTQGSLSLVPGNMLMNAALTTQAATGFGTTLDPAPSGVGTALPLGNLEVWVPPVGAGYHWTPTTYDNTPFYLTVTVNSLNGNAQAANPSSFTVGGYLNGTLSMNGPSSITATFERPDSVDPRFPQGTIGSFSAGGYDTFLSIPSGTVSSDNPVGAGGMTLTGEVVAEFSAPEPASWIVLGLLGLAQVGAVRWRGRRRRGLPG